MHFEVPSHRAVSSSLGPGPWKGPGYTRGLDGSFVSSAANPLGATGWISQERGGALEPYVLCLRA